jgi:hypothetical protein
MLGLMLNHTNVFVSLRTANVSPLPKLPLSKLRFKLAIFQHNVSYACIGDIVISSSEHNLAPTSYALHNMCNRAAAYTLPKPTSADLTITDRSTSKSITYPPHRHLSAGACEARLLDVPRAGAPDHTSPNAAALTPVLLRARRVAVPGLVA